MIRSPQGPEHLYVHVPFCRKKCRYCAFYSVEGISEPLLDSCLQALLVEHELRSGDLVWKTAFIGGGNPALLGLPRLTRLLRSLVTSSEELTLELNPEDVTEELVDGLMELGVNRLSMGVQSLEDRSLALLGRRHDAAQALAAAELICSRGMNLSLDLIYGVPSQPPANWLDSLERICALPIRHLSCYQLTLEPHTPLSRDLSSKRVSLPDEHEVEELFFSTAGKLEALGFTQYEVSNFAREEADRCRHNQAYWRHRPYLGLGPGAHSLERSQAGQARRLWNSPDLRGYLSSLSQRELPPGGHEHLGPEELLLEALMLGLRTTEGVDLEAAAELTGAAISDYLMKNALALESQGLIMRSGSRLMPTRAGLALADRLPLLLTTTT